MLPLCCRSASLMLQIYQVNSSSSWKSSPWKIKPLRPSPFFGWHPAVQMFLSVLPGLPLPGARLHCAKAEPATTSSAQYLCVRLLAGRCQGSSYPAQSTRLTFPLALAIWLFLCHVFPLGPRGANPKPSPLLQHEGLSAVGRRKRVHLDN